MREICLACEIGCNNFTNCFALCLPLCLNNTRETEVIKGTGSRSAMQESSRKTTSSSLDNISQWPSWKPVSRCDSPDSPDCRFFCPSMGSVNQDCYLRNKRGLLRPSVMAHYASASLSNSYFRELNNASIGRRKKRRVRKKKNSNKNVDG